MKKKIIVSIILFLLIGGIVKVYIYFNIWTAKMVPRTVTILVGETAQVKAIETGSIRINTFPSYNSSNTYIATVDDYGNVKGLREGEVIITGSYSNIIAGTTKVIIKENKK